MREPRVSERAIWAWQYMSDEEQQMFSDNLKKMSSKRSLRQRENLALQRVVDSKKNTLKSEITKA